jgi:hypothetical protein
MARSLHRGPAVPSAPPKSTQPDDPRQPLIYLRFRPAWTYIEGVREFCRFFCAATYKQEDLAERVRVVLQETLENAVKYSTPDQQSELVLEVQAEPDSFRIAVTSRPDPRHLQTLKNELSHLRMLDPEAAYLQAFVRAANEPQASSRLGLARMRYEARFELHLDEQSDGRVCITATGKP